jgi:RHS repeat-associated protein
LADPSAGTTNYTYNALGQIKTQTDAIPRLTTYTYLPDGRTDNVVSPEGTTTYTYNTNKQLTGISSPGSVSRTYGYDTKGRVNSVSETIAGSSFPTSFTYDNLGRLGTRTHPSGIVETIGYNSFGYQTTISAGGSIRYTVTSMNAREQLTGSTYGSTTPLTATYGFDAYGYPTSTVTGSIQDYRYVFKATTGNLTSRQNFRQNKLESFGYDTTPDRLDTVTGPQNLIMTYNVNGNINTKSDIGTSAFSYGTSAGQYALTGLTSTTAVIPATNQTATYTSFEKVNTLTEGVYAATFIYNADQQRAKMDVTQSGTNILTRWYAGSSYMKQTAAGVTNEYTYIGGDAYSAPIAAVTLSGVTTYYYLLRDHLGSITHVVRSTDLYYNEYSFDAWGRRRNPTDWSYNISGQPALFTDRGFTGHEHLPWFNLINMNGRLYDPLVGRFLSADNEIQDPTSTQNYNRYSYGLNNPLKYVDPSGNLHISNVTDNSVFDYIASQDGYFDFSGYNPPNGGGSTGGGGDSGGNYDEPGEGGNGTGLNGVYYDHKSAKYRSTYNEQVVGWDNAFNATIPNFTDRYQLFFTPLSSIQTNGGYKPDINGNRIFSYVVPLVDIHMNPNIGAWSYNLYSQSENDAACNFMLGIAVGEILGGLELGNLVTGLFTKTGTIEAKWIYGTFKSEAKWTSQLFNRGWTPEQITETITYGESFDAVNMVNKANPAVRYLSPTTGQSLVIDKVTNELLHVGGPGFKY